jgi:hypothetical protein
MAEPLQNLHAEKSTMSRFNSTTFMTGLLVGSAMGAIGALLCAPQEGRALSAIRRRHLFEDAGEPGIDETIDESFPASDPPSWTPTTTTPSER